MLATFQGVVKERQVRLFGTPPPDGTFVVVVAPELPSVEEQEARLRAIPLEERRKAFDEYLERARQGAAPEVDVATVSDQELVDVVHDVREGMQHNAGRGWHQWAIFVKPADTFPHCRDPKDDVVIATAVAAHAEYIVTNDGDLREAALVARLHDECGIQVVWPNEFLASGLHSALITE